MIGAFCRWEDKNSYVNIMEDHILLCDSTICRLCAEENENGILLFNVNENEPDLCSIINKYLPIKIQNDGKYPRTICPGCNIQLDALVQFMELIILGQDKIRTLWRTQHEKLRKKDQNNLENTVFDPETNVNPFTIQAIEDNGKEILIQIMPDGSLYAPEHEIALKVEGLTKPKRKRGRPPKPPPVNEPIEESKYEEVQEEEMEEELDADGRKRRRRKVPFRFREAVQGKELERIFREEGVIDEAEDTEDDDEPDEKLPPAEIPGNEIIGHLENQDGQDLGELVIINNNKVKHTRIKTHKTRRRKKFNCDICGRGFMHYGRYLIHKTYHKGVKYECTTCNETFNTKSELIEHQTTHNHIGEGIIETLESQSLEDEDSIKNELKPSDPISPEHKYSCDQCDKSFMAKQSYEVHVKAIHEGQKPFHCGKCDKTFAYQASFKGHMASHEQRTDKGYPCDMCDKIFNHPSSVVYHKESEHNNGRRFVCNKCGKSFKHKQLLQRHQLVHTDDRPYTCKLCNASFKTRANLLNHQPTHTGVKKYFCEECGQLFAHKTSLTLHYRWHSGQKPYECNVCKKTFSQKGNLREHKRIHTGEKPYTCTACDRRFTTSSQYKLHLKRHSGERPWNCEECNKSFLHKDTWKCHMRRHRNERPFQCQTCFRDFSEQWALKKHMRLHTGEKPYVCDVCNKAFADCSNLTKHKKIHKNIKPDPESITLNVVDSQESAVQDGNIIYMAYQDPTDSNDMPTLVHILDNSSAQSAEMNNVNQLTNPEENLENSLITTSPDTTQLGLEDFENGTNQLPLTTNAPIAHVTDEEGNPIYITAQNGQQIRVASFDGQNLQVCMEDGSIIPLELDNKNLSIQLNEPQEPIVQQQTSKKHMLDEQIYITAAELNANKTNGMMGNQNMMDQSVHFMTEDGQNLCLVTTVNLDTEIGTGYLDIT